MASKQERQRQLARDAYERRLERQAQPGSGGAGNRSRIVAVVVVIAVGVGLTAVLGGVLGPVLSPSAAAATGHRAATRHAPRRRPHPATPPRMVDGKCQYIASGTAARKVNLPPAKPDTKATYQRHHHHQPRQDRDRPDELRRTVHGELFRFAGRPEVLQQHALPPAHDQRDLRAAVRRPDRHRQGGPGYVFDSENLPA